MKNQYFGDNKDLFKYDLILRVVGEVDFIKRATIIPMLTEDDGWRDRKPGSKNKDLVDFLDSCRQAGERSIEKLEGFFEGKGVDLIIYKKNEEFPRGFEKRTEYFEGIGERLLVDSVVLIDPDTGLEVTNSGRAHVLYKEVKGLFNRLDASSILMIFQNFPRNMKHKDYLEWRSEELKEEVSGHLPLYIHDNKVIFFFMTKCKPVRRHLAKTINAYKKDYSELYTGGITS